MNSMATDSKKRLALAITDFLSRSLKDGTIDAADGESVEIATNCIAEAFHVDPTDQAAVKDALGGQDLLSIYGVYEKLKGRSSASAAASSSVGEASSAAASATSAPASNAAGTPLDPTAEELKRQGNAAMQRMEFSAAVEDYTKALEISPLNPIYLSNRAAAYSNLSQHELAKNDAEMATAADPKYTKAWSRLGLALFALGDAKGSMDAYAKGIEAEGNGGSDVMKKGFETAKRKAAEQGEDSSEAVRSTAGPGPGGAGGMPDLGSLASLLGGGGRGGGGGGAGAGAGGMPDISSLMNNPMMRQMAQNLMSNPETMNNLMSNPQVRDMASRFGRGGGGGGGGAAGGAEGAGGGMPDFSALMNDPSIAEMAKNLMGGMGGQGGAGRGQ